MDVLRLTWSWHGLPLGPGTVAPSIIALFSERGGTYCTHLVQGVHPPSPKKTESSSGLSNGEPLCGGFRFVSFSLPL